MWPLDNLPESWHDLCVWVRLYMKTTESRGMSLKHICLPTVVSDFQHMQKYCPETWFGYTNVSLRSWDTIRSTHIYNHSNSLIIWLFQLWRKLIHFDTHSSETIPRLCAFPRNTHCTSHVPQSWWILDSPKNAKYEPQPMMWLSENRFKCPFLFLPGIWCYFSYKLLCIYFNGGRLIIGAERGGIKKTD